MSSRARKLLKLLRLSAVAAPLFLGGCLSPHGGPAFLYWFAPPAPKVTGDGSSPESPLRIKHGTKDTLELVEASWVSERYGGTHEVMDEAFNRRLKIETQQIGNKIYDIATLTMSNGAVRTAYFDVTGYRPRARGISTR